MAHVRNWHDLYPLMVHSSAFLLEVVLGLVIFVTTLALLVRAVRALGVGQGSGAVRARARIDAEMRARAAGRNPRSTIPEPNAFERGLRRKLTSVEVILAQSTFAGERAAASKARDRLRAQLGKDAEPIEDA
jgi:hypothetical protein